MRRARRPPPPLLMRRSSGAPHSVPWTASGIYATSDEAEQPSWRSAEAVSPPPVTWTRHVSPSNCPRDLPSHCHANIVFSPNCWYFAMIVTSKGLMMDEAFFSHTHLDKGTVPSRSSQRYARAPATISCSLRASGTRSTPPHGWSRVSWCTSARPVPPYSSLCLSPVLSCHQPPFALLSWREAFTRAPVA